MSATDEKDELETAIEDAGLDDAEAAEVRELVAGGGHGAAAIEHVLGSRGIEPEPELTLAQKEQESGEPSKKRLAELESAIGSHLEHVAEIMGPFVAGFVPCSACGGAALVAPEPELRGNELFRSCPTCNGYGVVKTGARNEANYTRACPGCAGRGFQEAIDSAGAPIAPAPGASPAAPATPAPPAADSPPELVGFERGEPRFGVPTWMGDPALGET